MRLRRAYERPRLGLVALAAFGGEVRRAPLAAAAVLFLTALTAASASAGAATGAAVAGGADRLFTAAQAPDWVQMHSAPVDLDTVDAFAASHRQIRDHQVSPTLRLENAALVLDDRSDAARTGVMEILLVTQNERFDLLLGTDDAALRLEPGQVGVPVFYMREYDLEPGDTVQFVIDGRTRGFVIADRLRDAQMNPGIVNSKRFLLHETDWAELSRVLPQQSLITFQTEGDAVALADAYRAAGLPGDGPAVDGALLRLISSLTDGVVSAALLLLALVVFAVSALCLRLVILTALENGRARIALLRTLGFSAAHVGGAHLAYYTAIAMVGAGLGLCAAGPVAGALTAGVVADTGGAPGATTFGAAVGAGAAVLIATVCSAALVLHRIRRMSPASTSHDPALRPATWLAACAPASLWLALRSRLARPAGTALLLAIVVIAMVVAVVPVRLAQTIASPAFIATMGIGASDLRVFVPATAPADTAAEVLADLWSDDLGVVRSSFSTSRRVAVASAGYDADLVIETTDGYGPSPTYATGREPRESTEVAFSVLAAQTWGVDVGDTVRVAGIDGGLQALRVSGVYQDITNGGRSARSPSAAVAGPIVWCTMTADVSPGVDVGAVASALGDRHPAATITDVARFVEQTLGGTVGTLRAAALGAVGSSAVVLALVVLLLTRLESSRDRRGLRALRTVGFTAGSVRAAVALRAVVVAVVAAPVGVVAAEALAPVTFGAILTSMGGGAVVLQPDPALSTVTVLLAVLLVAVWSAAAASVPTLGVAALPRKEMS